MKHLKSVKMLFKLALVLQLLFNIQAYAMSTTERFLELDINSEKVDYIVKFNDVKVFNVAGKSPATQTVPVNQWSVNGDNKIFISVKLDNEEKQLDIANSVELTVSLILREKNNEDEVKHTLTTFNLKPSSEMPDKISSSSLQNIKLNSNNNYAISEDGDIIISEWSNKPVKKWVRFEQNIKIDTGLPTWSYLDAQDLGDDQKMPDKEYFALRDELHNEYKKIWELLNKEDESSLLELTKLRSSEYDSAFYLQPGSKQEDMSRSFNSAIDNKELSLYKLIDAKFTRLSILANGKIANLKAAKSGKNFILFSHKDGAFTRTYDFYFMKKDGKWIIIR